MHYNIGKCVFCLYSRTFVVSPAMRPPPENSSQIYAYEHVQFCQRRGKKWLHKWDMSPLCSASVWICKAQRRHCHMVDIMRLCSEMLFLTFLNYLLVTMSMSIASGQSSLINSQDLSETSKVIGLEELTIVAFPAD